jgi:hypothetical protein
MRNPLSANSFPIARVTIAVRFVHDTGVNIFPALLKEPPSYVPVRYFWVCHDQICLLLHALCQGGDKQVGRCQVLQDVHCEHKAAHKIQWSQHRSDVLQFHGVLITIFVRFSALCGGMEVK